MRSRISEIIITLVIILLFSVWNYAGELSGRVIIEKNQPVRNVIISVLYCNVLHKETRTNHFGYYYLDIPIECSVAVVAVNRRYTFAPIIHLLPTPEPDVNFVVTESVDKMSSGEILCQKN